MTINEIAESIGTTRATIWRYASRMIATTGRGGYYHKIAAHLWANGFNAIGTLDVLKEVSTEAQAQDVAEIMASRIGVAPEHAAPTIFRVASLPNLSGAIYAVFLPNDGKLIIHLLTPVGWAKFE